MKYRTLKAGEVLQRGDEYRRYSDGKWVKTVGVGTKTDESSSWRRIIPVNFQRVALRLSKAKSITEVRAIYRKAVARA